MHFLISYQSKEPILIQESSLKINRTVFKVKRL